MTMTSLIGMLRCSKRSSVNVTTCGCPPRVANMMWVYSGMGHFLLSSNGSVSVVSGGYDLWLICYRLSSLVGLPTRGNQCCLVASLKYYIRKVLRITRYGPVLTAKEIGRKK